MPNLPRKNTLTAVGAGVIFGMLLALAVEYTMAWGIVMPKLTDEYARLVTAGMYIPALAILGLITGFLLGARARPATTVAETYAGLAIGITLEYAFSFQVDTALDLLVRAVFLAGVNCTGVGCLLGFASAKIWHLAVPQSHVR